MGKLITSVFTPVEPGDYMYNAITGEKYEAGTCPDCHGSGMAGHGYTIYFQCPTCKGHKILWNQIYNETSQ